MSSDDNNNSDEKKYGKVIPNHSYDGIQELDNPLPGWWLATFYITIVFAALYIGYYWFAGGPTLTEEFDQAKKVRDTQMLATGQNKGPSDDELKAALASPKIVEKGKEDFTAKCASCHGDKGQGGIGPNLTDKFWIHGGKLADIAKTITDGVADKGMPPWGAMLSKAEIIELSAFVKSIGGTNPPNPKAPQGVEAKE